MATQSTTINAGQTLTISAITQVDSSGNPLPTPDPSYAAPVLASVDSTFFTELQSPVSGEFLLQSTGKAGTTTVSITETSSVASDPVLTDTITVIVNGPVPAGLQATFTAA